MSDQFGNHIVGFPTRRLRHKITGGVCVCGGGGGALTDITGA